MVQGKLWQTALSSLVKIHHLKVMLNLKTIVIYFIIMGGAKMVHAFSVSSVVRGYHEYKAMDLVSPCVFLRAANPYSSKERCYKLQC